jgi:nucleoside-diphosphate-sugar epimerase
MKENLVIGNTSQLSYYFPKDYKFISSRNIEDDIYEKEYDYVYILFAEQRTFLNEDQEFFNKTNVHYTLNIINKLRDISNKIVIYSTSELWNNVNGDVSVHSNYDYNYTPYIKSKEILCNCINDNRDYYNNVVIIYPFNFNSIYRKPGFLFSKIFNSILNNEKSEIGNIDFNRDLIHPSVIVRESIGAKEDKLIGSGELININKFVIDLFIGLNLDIKDYLKVGDSNFLQNKRNEYYSNISYSNYKELIELTIEEIKNIKL